MMINLIDFNRRDIAIHVYYGGNAGAKTAIYYEGGVWMLKYPKTTRDMINPQISYTTSPLSEYIGSKIYEALGIPVHETILGICNGKTVVACKDFTRKYDATRMGHNVRISKHLIPFHDLKNSFMSNDLESYSGTGSETLLDEVLATIAGQDALKAIPGVLERFWDMFVIDAFIGNNDRNNGNWGILIDDENGEIALAPVYDNGNAFFNKRSIAAMEKRLIPIPDKNLSRFVRIFAPRQGSADDAGQDGPLGGADAGLGQKDRKDDRFLFGIGINNETAMKEDALITPRCVYKYTGTDTEGQQINPFTFIIQGQNPDCNAAVLRFVNALDFEIIENIIYDIPEVSGTISVMPEIQKKFYLELMKSRYDYMADCMGHSKR